VTPNLADTGEALVELRLVHLVANGDDQAAVVDLAATQLLGIGQVVNVERIPRELRSAEANASLLGVTEHALGCVVRPVAAGTEGHAL